METNSAKKGTAVSLAGMACNLLLAAAKLAAGLLFGLVSVAADGMNNLSDCASGAVSLVSFRLYGKPADREHPYGHRRAEYLAALLTGVLVLLLAAELTRGSVSAILAGETGVVPWYLFLLTGVSVAVKGALFFLYRAAARKLKNDALRAAATDSLCDCAATLAVAAGLVLSARGIPADGWIGVAVALFIGWQGVRILAEESSKLLGQAPDRALVASLGALLREAPEVLGYHDLHVFTYGSGVTFATVHVEMDASLSSLRAHAVLDGLERAAAEREGVALTTHFDPVDRSDRALDALRRRVTAAAQALAEDIDLHDFRLVRGATTKVIFEAGVPFSCKRKDDEIRAELENIVRSLGDYRPVVTVERE